MTGHVHVSMTTRFVSTYQFTKIASTSLLGTTNTFEKKMCKVPFLLLVSLALCWAGDNDTYEQLRVAYSNFRHEDSVYKGPVTTESGYIPEWLNGSFIRHSCGVFGEAFTESEYINHINHLFDCIETGQSFHFQNGDVTYTNKYYDTNANDIFLSYEQNMNLSSFWIGSTFSNFNVSQMMKHRDDMNRPGKVPQVPHVSWWDVGGRAVAMTEYPFGVVVDVDSVESLGYFPYSDNNMGYEGFVNYENSPAHEHTEADGTVWSTVGAWQRDDEDPNILRTWRAVYTLNPETNERVVIGERKHADVDLRRCDENPGAPYPDPEGRIRYMHAFQMTENYIALLETSYMFDPCSRVYGDSNDPYFVKSYRYEPEINGVISVMRKSDGEFVANIQTPPYFATHMLGAYEDGNVMNLDFLWYNNTVPYTEVTYYENLFKGATYNTYVKRFVVNMDDWTLAESKDIMNNLPQPLEMSNINYKYQGQKYKYAYMVRNIFTLNATLIKLNVDDGSYLEYQMPDGIFPQEPWFVETPGGEEEDDGVLLVQGVDGVKEKGFLMVFDARDLSLVGHVTGTELTLFGLHNKFYAL